MLFALTCSLTRNITKALVTSGGLAWNWYGTIDHEERKFKDLFQTLTGKMSHYCPVYNY